MPRTPPPPLIHLSLVVGKPLRSAEGTLLGVAVDLTAQLVGGRARISGAIIRIDGGDTYVPAAELASIDHGGLRLEPAPAAELGSFELASG